MMEPFRDIMALSRTMSNYFDEIDSKTFGLPVDLKENEDEFVVEADLPGFNKDEVEIEVNNQTVRIKAEKKVEEEETKDEYIVRERRVRNVTRTLKFGKPINAKKAKVSLGDGVLTLVLPKAEEAKAVKLIPE